MLATIALHSVARLIKGTLLPEERTGLFFVPLGILLAAISIHNLGDAFGQKMLKSAGWFCFPLLIGCFLYSFHVSYFRVWKHDAGSKEVFFVLNSLERDSVRSGVGLWPFFAASLDFYRSYYKAEERFPRFTFEEPTEKESVFVLMPSGKEYRLVREYNLKIIYQHPISHAVVAIR